MEVAAVRRHQRILVSGESEIRVVSLANWIEINGIVSVIGLGGMFVRSIDAAPPGSVLTLAATCPFLSIESRCKVRYVTEVGMGVEFMNLTSPNEQKLKWLLYRLRKQSLTAL